MKAYRNKLSLAVALLSAASLAQAEGFELSEKLSVTGFIDMSTTYTDPENGGSSTSTGLDQFEMDFLYTFDDKLSATVDLEYQDDGRTDSGGDAIGEETDVEQAYFNYAVTDSFSVKAGRFLSYAGWETEDPTGLFQYSGTGYAGYFYGGYQQGMSGLFSSDTFDVAVSVVNDLGDLEGEARDSTKPAIETMLAIKPTDDWVAKFFYSTDENETTGEDIVLINMWTSYTVGDLILAAEYNMSEDNPVYATNVDDEASGYLVMANYAMGKAGITLRYHAWEIEDDAGNTLEEISGITISPSYAVSDNLLIVAEYRTDDDDVADSSTDYYALEALISY
jgi:hypothetical protein